MADDRLKAVANVDSKFEGLEVMLEDEEYIESEELELDLSLGWWGWPAGPSSSGGGRMGGWLSPLDLTVESPRLIGSEAGNEQASMSGTNFQFKKPKLLALPVVPQQVDYTSTPSGSDASAAPTSRDCTNDQASLFQSETASSGRCRDQDDDGHIMNFNDGRGGDGDNHSTSNVEVVEIKMDLTEDLLHLVFSFLSHKDLCKAGATCKQWLVASMHDDFWRCLNFKNTEISQHSFEAICHRYTNGTEVNLSGVYNLDVLAMEAMASLR